MNPNHHHRLCARTTNSASRCTTAASSRSQSLPPLPDLDLRRRLQLSIAAAALFGWIGIATNNVKLFSYNSLRSATGLFHPSNKIGRGSLERWDSSCCQVLSAESKQGTDEFLTELNSISNIRHPNLVQLIGCCVEGNNRILVYEYLENNSLASALLGNDHNCG
ncbi:hypothetical protein BUALT_Bualt03G0152100 [Buddleja alternifolia]|uniref:Serine-threonine/tyrosine-protein kinase catalytic domain-containing protein n=1 Tax=Buddleja alternifolia TaxID=168488 RepID=A0AAV6XTY0_9LAMI|nr:hypothetical protein BUALT_Bualt03G0152100 [Buddleja alternifolia]